MNASSAQLQHKKQQLENRITYYEKGDRRKRAHHLITRGAAIESVAPLTKVLTETEFYTFAEKVLAVPEVKGLLMEAVNEHNRAESVREVIEYRTISFSCDTNQAQRRTICCGMLPPIAPAKSCTANTTARTATTPARAA